MEERRKHRRFPAIQDFAEPIELAILHDHKIQHIPGVVTNLSAGGMDIVLMGQIEGKPHIKLSLRLPGFDRFEVEGKIIWSKTKGATSIIGLKFTKIDAKHANQINHMAQVYWEEKAERTPSAN